jgi:hypothetical protein
MSYLPNIDTTASGSITTQNLVVTGSATVGAAVAISLNAKTTLAIQVTGTYTGALSLQLTNDDTTWVTQSGLNSDFILQMSDASSGVNIPSGATGIWQCEVAAHSQARITALGVVTGTAVITLRASQGISQVNIADTPLNLSTYSSINNELLIGTNTTLNAYTQALYRDDELWDTALVGGGTATWTQAAGGCAMTVSVANDAVIRQSKLSAQYLASAPQVFDMTYVDITPIAGVIKRLGYFTATTTAPHLTAADGFMLETDDTTVYFRIYKNGSIVFSAAQASWDDPMDGKGRSRTTLSTAAFNAFWGEFLYLGGTQCNFGFILPGKGPVVMHTFANANVNNTTFVNSPNQKLTYSIHRTSGSGAASLVQICSKVGSLGQNSQKIKIRAHLYSVGGIYTFQPPTIGTNYAWMGVKLNTRLALAWIESLRFTSTTADDIICRIRRNPTVSGAGLTYTAIANTPYSIGMAPTPASPTITVSGGTIVFEEVVSALANQEFALNIDNLLLSLGQSIAGIFDEFIICFEPITANLNIRGSIQISTNN